MNEATIPTSNVLRSLGFQPDENVISDVPPGLSFDFGNLRLSASCVTNLRFVQVVLFCGVLATRRTVAEVQFELPRRVESLNQCVAWIVWNLDQYGDRHVFRPIRYVAWLEEGRQNRRLLPWVMSQAEFDARPQCTVQRDWLRLALKTLREQLASLPDDLIVVFSFDGAVFSIRCNTKVIAFPAEGLPWTVCFRVQAKTLRRQPKRLMREDISVSLWESRIRFDSWSYEGTVEPFGGRDFSVLH